LAWPSLKQAGQVWVLVGRRAAWVISAVTMPVGTAMIE
jgi:hypothetical protein